MKTLKYMYIQQLSDPYLQSRLKALLLEEDNSFVPPLSSRSSTTQQFDKDGKTEHALNPYYEMLLKHSIIIVLDDDKLAGFMAFIEHYNCPQVEADDCIYVTTIIVNRAYRGNNITENAYDFLFSLAGEQSIVSTRTWSTNYAHIRILERKDFQCVLTIENDRGEGIDTLYFRKTLE